MKRIDSLLQKCIDDGVFPGVSLLAFEGDQIRLETFRGSAQLQPTVRPITENTSWDLASLSKPFSTASLCMRAFEAKKFDVDDSVSKYFPKFKKDQIKLSHLLNHSSGLPGWKAFYETIPSDLIGKPEAKVWVIDQICEIPLEYETGTKVVYCDLGYILLGGILEQIYKAPQDVRFQREVLTPLQIQNTRYLKQKEDGDFAATEFSNFRKRILCGEVDDDNTFVMGGVAGHAGLFSNCQSVFQWLRELARVKRGESSWLQQSTFEKFGFIPKDRDLKKPYFALGFDTPVEGSSAGKYFSPQSLGHLGFAGTSFWWDLERDFGIILLTNRVHPNPENNLIRSHRKLIHEAVCEALKLGQ